MITDNKTNFLYLADFLQNSNEYKPFLERFKLLLEDKNNDIQYDFIKGTKDIWARDYMPVQIEKNKFVKFTYNPDY